MQVNYVSRIELIFADDYRYSIRPLHNFRRSTQGYSPIDWNFILFNHGRPIAFIWHDSHLYPTLPKVIKWINTEFKPIFDYDPLKWFASVGTCSPKFRKHLKDFYGI